MFVGWLPAIAIKRFGRARYDTTAKIVTIGRYRAAFLFLKSKDIAKEGIKNNVI
jgi:hypothetical protein